MFEKELKVATEAVRLASLLTKRVQSQVIAHRDSSTVIKSDMSPVTIGDFAAQTVIINAIKSNFPEDHVVGEETAEGLGDPFLEEILKVIDENETNFQQYNSAKDAIPFKNQQFPLKSVDDVRKVINFGDYQGGRTGRFWCLDPIDGTKGFLRGEQFAVCLALIVDGVTQVGCIGCPNLTLANYGSNDLPGHEPFGYIFRAVRGHGSFYTTNTLQEPWVPIHVRQLKNTHEMVTLEGVEKSHSSHDEQDEIKKRLGITQSLHLDSQAKYCLLALGLADVYLRLPIKLSYQEKIWDHGAGNVIVLEAGGQHTDAFNDVPLDFGNGRVLLTKGVIASSGPQKLHDLVVSTSADVMGSRK
ncbi:similar to Saccharomyces cerevisiae YOL064C MET22 Bisphosphate-3'-nucleotidase, involved in salt tolerance and methionine biogenesis [Maudiozyma saulgeensis]|uniref:3'(2'),5'-bisphosphate nucleotidase n=1 Tax=Maudiozyma saulgeensis TaxID=1789683 RepID=A0A1X7RBA3_9SACH|nr:similar to Saccharomyces cerevisiae YOL064C MET22 Bisphosphate-3'-nucleotidase, involved in salt tolerance and methionine biogenesis [Kazachstania saulgeensis]